MNVDFCFDLSSPYSYLAATQMPALAARTGATVRWLPMVLNAVFRETDNRMPATVPAKARYMLGDLERWAAHYGVPFTFSPHFPSNTIQAMRLVLAAEVQGRAEQTALTAFRAMWVDGRDLADPAVVEAVAREAGLDAERALAAIQTPAIKERLRALTDQAIARGAFGAPAIFVGEELFWGNDRLHFVEAALATAGAEPPA